MTLRLSLIFLVITLFSLHVRAVQNVSVHLCDKLAAHPSEHTRVTIGKIFDKIDADAAITACVDAVKSYPDVARFQFQLGRAYDKKGQSVTGVQWYREGAKQGHTIAQYNIGIAYTFGTGVEQNYTEGVYWFRQSAEQGFSLAQYQLANAYLYGEGVKKSYVKAALWNKKAAEQGVSIAQFNIGYAYHQGEGIEQNYVEAAKWYKKAAEQGDAGAQFNLAQIYYYGEGIEQDYTRAFEWFLRAAEQGDVNGMTNLGMMLLEAKGTNKSILEAISWLNKAAETGDIDAEVKLFESLLNDRNIKIFEPSKATKYILSAAKNTIPSKLNHNEKPRAKYLSYSMLDRGYGVDRNQKEAIEWLKESANDGYVLAQIDLAHRLATGDKIAQNEKKAKEIFSKLHNSGQAVPKFFGDEDKNNIELPLLKRCSKLWSQTELLSNRPGKDPHIPIDLSFKNSLVDLNWIDTKSQTVNATLKLNYYFKDVRYLFDEKYFDTDTCSVAAHVLWESEPGKIPISWSPEITALNASKSTTQQAQVIHLRSKGQVGYESQITGDFKTNLNLTDFPFDHQTVPLKFGSLPYSLSEVRLIPLDAEQEKVKAITGSDRQEWNIIDKTLTFSNEVRDDRLFSIATLNVKIKRNPYYYVYKVLLPLFLLFLVSTSQFWLRWDRLDARVSIATTSLVAVIAYQFLIQGDLPKLPYMTLLDKIVFLTFFMIALSVAELVVVFSLIRDKQTNLELTIFKMRSKFNVNPMLLAEKIDLYSRYMFPLLWSVIAGMLAIGPIWKWVYSS
jgi:TPR repeat protein